ncbi:MAG: AraC family transcriptional regulator [Cyanosarcina radialis HA8281-LM2]|jgi:AraC-like DNA-binding protein|nr:AraC family transcriptional regulator [Cyanosarcina radialis HA8281-LM2]
MTITISRQAYDEILHQETVERSQHPDPDDLLDVAYRYPPSLGRGYTREIELREGLQLTLGKLQLHDRMMLRTPEGENYLEYHFHFSGEHQDRYHCLGSGQYGFYGSGLFPQDICDCGEKEPYLEVVIQMQPELLYSFAADREGQLPPALQRWIRPLDRELYSRMGTATPAMQMAAKQIVRCPYQGIAKRMYLEGKVLELIGMTIDLEIEIGDGDRSSYLDRSDAVERIHHAKELLLQRLDDPPSLAILARLVGLNECSLKRGFREIFGTTVFGYLHHHRLEQARQLLEAGNWKVGEAAKIVGYKDLTAFGRAFSQKFGMRPRDYMKKYSA